MRICTGRRHQIRAHLHHIWHPTVADGKYTKAEVFITDKVWCARNWLHRCRLTFHDTVGAAHETTEALPEDLRTALQQLTPRDSHSAAALREWLDNLPIRAWTEYAVLEDCDEEVRAA